jgi:TolB protein
MPGKLRWSCFGACLTLFLTGEAIPAAAQARNQPRGGLAATGQPLPGSAPARLWVRLRDESGQPLAARIYLTDGDGNTCVPSGTILRQGRARERYFHAAGEFKVDIASDSAVVEAVKGFEYLPVRQQVRLMPDQTAAVTLTLRRTNDMPALGWHPGDVHMHPNHRLGGLYIGMEDSLLLAAGEDIRVANLLISSVGDIAHVFDTELFRGGKPDPLSTPETLLVVQEEFRNTSAMYGHMALLGISRLVEPFFSGQPNSSYWEDYPPNYTIARKAKEQGAAVAYLHPSNGPGIPSGYHVAREFPIDLALGVVDALDVLSNLDEEGACWIYYKVLNSGLKCTASAGTDSQMDGIRAATPGGSKVYVKAGNPLTYETWVAAYKAGRTFVSNGPLLWLEAGGKEPGEEIRLPAPGAVEVVARTQSIVPIETLELIVNGQVVAAAKPSADGSRAELRTKLSLENSSWVAARVWGPGHRLVMNDPKAFAHTSPVYCYVGNRPIALPEDARVLVTWIDGLIEDVRKSPRFESETRRQEVIALFEKGREYYRKVAAGE